MKKVLGLFCYTKIYFFYYLFANKEHSSFLPQFEYSISLSFTQSAHNPDALVALAKLKKCSNCISTDEYSQSVFRVNKNLIYMLIILRYLSAC